MRLIELSPRHRMPSIRMINLVDILLNLLIFFIASTTFRVAVKEPTAVKLTLPEARTAEPVGKTEIPRLRITVAADNQIYLGEIPVTIQALENALKAAREKNPRTVLDLSADKNASYGTIVAIVDAARIAGIRDITAFTRKAPPPVDKSTTPSPQ
ncbi:MAG: biopolymer transporter ExbD [Verrucomicrobiae bacterium]|nr:biopolymer transporter ExbD [Verrucomicrobiae bacterium]